MQNLCLSQTKLEALCVPGIWVKSPDITELGTSLLQAVEMREEGGGKGSRIKNCAVLLTRIFVCLFV